MDEVLVLVMKSPRSYTREDVVEIHCHGGKVCTDRVLNTCIEAGRVQATNKHSKVVAYYCFCTRNSAFCSLL